MTVMLISVRPPSIHGRNGLNGLQRNVRKNVDSEPDRESVKKQPDVSEKVVSWMIAEIRNVSGQPGKIGQNVLRSVGEVEGIEIGNVVKKTNVMELVMRKKIATKMPVSGQLGPRGLGVVKEQDFVLKRTDVTETEKKQIQIVTNRDVNQVGLLEMSVN